MSGLKVLVVGESWHGSNCTGLARGFRSGGHAVDLIGLDQFFPAVDQSILARGLRRALNPVCRDQVQPPCSERSALTTPQPRSCLQGDSSPTRHTGRNSRRWRLVVLCDAGHDLGQALAIG